LLRSGARRTVRVTVPVGGTALWVGVAPDVDIERWCLTAVARKVIFEAGSRFCRRPAAAAHPYRIRRFEAELAAAVRVLALTLAEARKPAPLTAAS
jgi:DNA-binding transcriptional MocR family regulator